MALELQLLYHRHIIIESVFKEINEDKMVCNKFSCATLLLICKDLIGPPPVPQEGAVEGKIRCVLYCLCGDFVDEKDNKINAILLYLMMMINLWICVEFIRKI